MIAAVPFVFAAAGGYLLWKQTQAAAPASASGTGTGGSPGIVADQVGSNFSETRFGSDLGDAVHGLSAEGINEQFVGSPYAKATAQTAEGKVEYIKDPTGYAATVQTATGSTYVDTRGPSTKTLPVYQWIGGFGYVKMQYQATLPIGDSRSTLYTGGPQSNYP